jgi:lysozyme family protein
MPQYRFERLRDEYARLWAAMHVVKGVEAARQARGIIGHKDRYKTVEARTGVPWFVVGCLHMRESNADFSTWAHNGDRMRHNGVPVRTIHVTKGRPPDPNVNWEEGAYDALVVCERMNEFTDWGPERVAYAAELFNGFGYRHPARNIPSPYLWGGTSVQKRGKFVQDNVYDPKEMDPQIGAMAVLKMLMELDAEAQFHAAPPASVPDHEPAPYEPVPPLSPRADDTETRAKPLHKSRTIKGIILTYGTTAWGMLMGFIDKLHDPYYLAAFLGLLAVGAFGVYLAVTGRINVQKLVAHLSDDDTESEAEPS